MKPEQMKQLLEIDQKLFALQMDLHDLFHQRAKIEHATSLQYCTRFYHTTMKVIALTTEESDA